ncbi:MAG: hypothetical protein MHM6MM_008526 [Cercozoa sp. M6MM]
MSQLRNRGRNERQQIAQQWSQRLMHQHRQSNTEMRDNDDSLSEEELAALQFIESQILEDLQREEELMHIETETTAPDDGSGVICPACRQQCLRYQLGVFLCPCGFRFSAGHCAPVTPQTLSQMLEAAEEQHCSRGCRQTPTARVVPLPPAGKDAVLLYCTACQWECLAC